MEKMSPEERKEFKKEYKRNLYAKRKEAGICVRCGRAKSVSGKTMCQDCLDQMLVYSKRPLPPEEQARRDKHVQEYYQAHKENNKARARQRYRERREKGLCTKCGKPSCTGTSICDSCKASRRKRVFVENEQD